MVRHREDPVALVVDDAEERDLVAVHEHRGAPLGDETVQGADTHQVAHDRTSRVGPATSTPLRRSSAVAGRRCPRSVT